MSFNGWMIKHAFHERLTVKIETELSEIIISEKSQS